MLYAVFWRRPKSRKVDSFERSINALQVTQVGLKPLLYGPATVIWMVLNWEIMCRGWGLLRSMFHQTIKSHEKPLSYPKRDGPACVLYYFILTKSKTGKKRKNCSGSVHFDSILYPPPCYWIARVFASHSGQSEDALEYKTVFSFVTCPFLRQQLHASQCHPSRALGTWNLYKITVLQTVSTPELNKMIIITIILVFIIM